MSVLLLIYGLFVVTYCSVMGYAMYRVWLFGQYRILAGSSILITLCYMVVVLGIIAFTLIGIGRYRWDDSTGFYVEKVLKMSGSQKNINPSGIRLETQEATND